MDSCFYPNISDISQSQTRTVPVSKGTSNKSITLKFLQFCDLKTQQRYILHEEVIKTKGKLSSLSDSLHIFLKKFDEACKCLQFPLSKSNFESQYTMSKGNLFTQ